MYDIQLTFLIRNRFRSKKKKTFFFLSIGITAAKFNKESEGYKYVRSVRCKTSRNASAYKLTTESNKTSAFVLGRFISLRIFLFE